MHLQDAYHYDLERVRRCVIHYATPDGKLYPICTYNSGPCYREKIERQFSTPWDPKTQQPDAIQAGVFTAEIQRRRGFILSTCQPTATSYCLSRRPFHVATPNQVQVQMEDRLSRLGADVVDRAIAIFDAALLPELSGD
jgi:hypothetical protein